MSVIEQSVPVLLTPGPLTTRPSVRAAMDRDWGSRDEKFIRLTDQIRERLVILAEAQNTHEAIPIQGSGTFLVEAVIGTLIRSSDKLLVLVNGAYGDRMVRIANRLGLRVKSLEWSQQDRITPTRVDEELSSDPEISHVAMVHCETSSGILNPLESIANVVATHHCAFLLDAMSSFGAMPINVQETPISAVMASSNKCLEGVPGLGFALIEKQVIRAAQDNNPSVSLDLYDQWMGFQSNGQWRFTPPVQVVASLHAALIALENEGGQKERLRRYQDNCDCLVTGMEQLGFRLFLQPSHQSPIIVTFCPLKEPWFDFDQLYDLLAARGFLIYPGKLTSIESFRIGCIGALDRHDMERFLAAMADAISELRKLD